MTTALGPPSATAWLLLTQYIEPSLPPVRGRGGGAHAFQALRRRGWIAVQRTTFGAGRREIRYWIITPEGIAALDARAAKIGAAA